jgi:hypothetical protein
MLLLLLLFLLLLLMLLLLLVVLLWVFLLLIGLLIFFVKVVRISVTCRLTQTYLVVECAWIMCDTSNLVRETVKNGKAKGYAGERQEKETDDLDDV